MGSFNMEGIWKPHSWSVRSNCSLRFVNYLAFNNLTSTPEGRITPYPCYKVGVDRKISLSLDCTRAWGAPSTEELRLDRKLFYFILSFFWLNVFYLPLRVLGIQNDIRGRFRLGLDVFAVGNVSLSCFVIEFTQAIRALLKDHLLLYVFGNDHSFGRVHEDHILTAIWVPLT